MSNIDQKLQMLLDHCEDADIIVILDIDETLLDSMERWVTYIREEIKIDVPLNIVRQMGGLSNYFRNTTHFQTYQVLAEKLYCDPIFNAELPCITEAQEVITRLLKWKRLKIGAYLTARPDSIISVTETDLDKYGFPAAPVIARPSSVSKAEANSWKIAIIKSIKNFYDGHIIIIDDNLDLARRLNDINCTDGYLATCIVALQEDSYQILRGQIDPMMNSCHTYFAKWSEVEELCKKYYDKSK